MTKHRSKFNKSKCLQCKYRCTFSGGAGLKVSPQNVACYYGALSQTGTCLRLVNKQIVDIRGDDYNNCKLYEKGTREKNKYGYT